MDVSFLEPVFAAPGPYATVCADVTHTSENADTELELRVRAISERLTEQGAPEAVVEEVRGRLLEGNEGGEAGRLRGRGVVAAADRLRRPRRAAGRRAVARGGRVVSAAGPAADPPPAARAGPAHRRAHRPGGGGHHLPGRTRAGRGREDGGGRDLPHPQGEGRRLGARPLAEQRREPVGGERGPRRRADRLVRPPALPPVRADRR